MATKTYEFVDDETGQVIAFDGPDDATPEEIADVLDQMAGQAQPVSPSRTPQPPVAQSQIAPSAQAPIAPPVQGTSLTEYRGGSAAPTTSYGVSQRNRSDVEAAVESMYQSGERDTARYNAMLVEQFPDLTPQERPFITPEMLAGADAITEYYNQNPQRTRPQTFVFNQETGMPEPQAPETVAGELGQGVQRGLSGLANTATGLAGVAADVVGADETAQVLVDKYVRDSIATELHYGATVDSVRDIESWGDAGRYAVAVIGEFLPQITSGVGSGMIGKEIAERAAANTVRRIVDEQVAAGMTREAAEQFAARTARQWAERGMTAGAAANSIGQETGSVYGDTYAQTGERAPFMALTAGTVAGALDAILPSRIGNQLTSEMRERFTDRILREGGEGFLLEGGTEAAQTFIEALPRAVITGESPFTEEMYLQMEEAFVRGGIGGSATSAATSMFTGSEPGTPARPSLNGNFGLTNTISRPTANPRRATRLYPQQLQQSAQEMADRVNTLTESWTERPQITVHPDFKKVEGIDNDALGAYVNGEIILNAENLIAEADARGLSIDNMVAGVTFHEALGHHALTREYGDGLNTLLESFYYNGAPEFRNTVDRWMDDNPDAYQGDPNREARATEEVLAEYAERDGQLTASMMDQVKNYIKDFARRAGINLAVSEREVKAILAVAQRNFVEGRGTEHSPSDGTRYMYVGTKARNADITGFERLVEAAEEGEDVGPASQARRDTGWFIGPDSMPRFEIDDSNVYWSPTDAETISEELGVPIKLARALSSGTLIDDLGNKAFNKGTNLYGAPLGAVIDHPTLFEAYPELEDIRVYRDATEFDKGNDGTFWPSQQMIYINPRLKGAKAMEVLLHEVQHAVQHIEGFAFGGSPKAAINRMSDEHIINASKMYLEDAKRIAENEWVIIESLKELVKLPSVRALYKSMHAFDNVKPPYSDELYGRYYYAEGMVRQELGYDPDTASKEQRYAYERLYDVLLEDAGYTHAIEGLESQREEILDEGASLARLFKSLRGERLANELRLHFGNKDRESFQAYRHLFGEVEARDTEDRSRLNAADRRDTIPYTGAGRDVDPKDYIFDARGDDGDVAESRARDELLKKDRRSRVRTAEDNTRNEIEAAIRAGIDPAEVGLPAKYARRSKPKKEALTLEDLTAEELVESRNALSMVDHLVEDIYSKTSFTNDELTQAVLDRGVPPSAIVKRLNVEPGKLTKDMIRYDIAAQKLNARLSQLYGKMVDGSATQKDRVEFTKTSLALDDVASNLFGLQSEFGRALQAIQKMEYTQKKLTSLREALKGIQGAPEGLYALDDPETFLRYAKGVMEQMEAKTPKTSTTNDKIVSMLNLPRAVMSSMDLSAPLRQGLYFINKGAFWRSLPAMFKAFNPANGEAFYKEVMRSIQANPNYDLMMRGGLSLTSLDGPVGKAEEQFASDLAQKIPGVRMSERAYVGFLNKLRADVFSQYVEKMRAAGIDVENKETLRALGAWVNAGSGRGNLPKIMEGGAPMLNALFFSPRLISSRLTLISSLVKPSVYGKMPKELKREIIKQNLAFGSIAILTLGLISQAIPEAEVEKDPRSSDFGKVKIGNTRYDILGGFSQYFTLGGRLAAYSAGMAGFDVGGDRKTTSGQLVEYSNEFGATNALDAVIDFFRNKLSPNASFVADYLAGENTVGEEFTLSGAATSRMLPMVVQDFAELTAEHGMVEGAAMTAPVLFGVGVNTYVPKALDTAQKLTVQETFKATGYADSSNEFVTISGEDATLTEAGKNLWTDALNEVFADVMEQRIAQEDWSDLSDLEKAAEIQKAKDTARTEARRYVYNQIGM